MGVSSMPWGDVVIAEFVSVTEAVPCAVETQQARRRYLISWPELIRVVRMTLPLERALRGLPAEGVCRDPRLGRRERLSPSPEIGTCRFRSATCFRRDLYSRPSRTPRGSGTST